MIKNKITIVLPSLSYSISMLQDINTFYTKLKSLQVSSHPLYENRRYILTRCEAMHKYNHYIDDDLISYNNTLDDKIYSYNNRIVYDFKRKVRTNRRSKTKRNMSRNITVIIITIMKLKQDSNRTTMARAFLFNIHVSYHPILHQN